MAPTHAAVALAPAVLRLHQHHGRFMAVFGLAADIAHRLVDQDGDLLALLLLGLARYFNLCVDGHRLAHHRRRAIDTDPATRNPVIGFTA